MSPTLNLINDYSHFVITSLEVISTSALHIYHSALPLSPQTSNIRELYKPYAHPLARVVQGVPISWEPISTTVRHHSPINTAIWSPCSRYIAVSLVNPPTIEILDAVTLEQLQTLNSPQGQSRLLSFSPDSCSLTQFSFNHHAELVTWDLQTGSQIGTTPLALYMSSPWCFLSIHSINKKMVVLVHRDSHSTAATGISIYNLHSGICTYSYHVSEGSIAASIWTHGEYLRFVTLKPGSITIWEVGFTSIHTLTKVESLPIPDDVGYFGTTLFHPTISRLAFVHQWKVLIWDTQSSKLLLDSSCSSWDAKMSFSSDGHFFACEATNQEAHLWKESPAGYILHRKLVSGIGKSVGNTTFTNHIRPLLSPNGRSIITSRGQETQLWYTTDPTSSSSSLPTQPATLTNFLLDFSSDGLLAATARFGNNIATVLNLKSSNPQLIINTGMGIWGLRITGNTIFVVGSEGRIITWDITAGNHLLNTRVNINNSVQTITLNCPTLFYEPLLSAAISPDSSYIVITGGMDESLDVTWGANKGLDVTWGEDESLDIYDMSTGDHLTSTTTRVGDLLWITPDGCEVWSSGVSPMGPQGLKIIKDGESNVIRLEHLPENTHPSGGYPWRSSHGHRITDDGWIFNSRKKRLMWLPHQWRMGEQCWSWDGQFLGLLNHKLPDPIIIELGE